MTVAAFLSSTYRYLEDQTVTDVQEIMNLLDTELEALGWTDEGGGVYKSPVDAASRFFKIALTRVSATNIQMDAVDQNGVTVSQRRAYCDAASNTVRLYTGSHHVIVDIQLPSNREAVGAGMLDASPRDQGGLMTRYVWGTGYRTTANSASGYSASYASMLDAATVSHTARINLSVTLGGNGAITKTLGGRWIYRPLDFFASSTATSTHRYFAGRAYQLISVADSFSTPGMLLEMPIDNGTTGQFRVIGGVIANNAKLWACRVG